MVWKVIVRFSEYMGSTLFSVAAPFMKEGKIWCEVCELQLLSPLQIHGKNKEFTGLVQLLVNYHATSPE
jgi:hypothetical protein